MIQKINESKTWFFEMINEIDKSLARLKEKRERTQINTIRNDRGEITTDIGEITSDIREIQRIIRKYEQLYANKLDNLDEMYKFLETYNLPKINQEESENLNRQITPNETEALMKKLPTNKSPEPEAFTGEFCQTFLELTPLFHETIL